MDNRSHTITRGERGFWWIIVLISIVEIVVFVTVRQWEYVFPSSDVRRLYNHYRNTDNINAVFVKGYIIDDSTTADVTVLEALNDSTWDNLLNSLCISPPPPDILENYNFDAPTLKIAPKRNYCEKTDTIIINNDLIAIRFKQRQLYVFNIENEQQFKIIFSKKAFNE